MGDRGVAIMRPNQDGVETHFAGSLNIPSGIFNHHTAGRVGVANQLQGFFEGLGLGFAIRGNVHHIDNALKNPIQSQLAEHPQGMVLV